MRKSAQLHVLSGIVAQNHSFLFLSSWASIFTDLTFALSFSWRTSKRERSAERREANVSPLGLDGTVLGLYGEPGNPTTGTSGAVGADGVVDLSNATQ